MTTLNGVEAMQSAAFASTTNRIRKSEIPDNPGPGAYDPNFGSIEANLPSSNVMSKVGRASHYTGDHLDGGAEDSTTGPAVGPGTYDPELQKDGTRDTMSSRVEQRSSFGGFGWSASFISESLRTMFSGIFPDRSGEVAGNSVNL